MTSLSRGLQEHQTIFLGKPGVETESMASMVAKNNHYCINYQYHQPAGLKKSDLPLLLQIGFVADHQDDNGRAGQRPRICQPVGQTIERLPELDFVQETI